MIWFQKTPADSSLKREEKCIRYEVEDPDYISLPADTYNVVIAGQSVHHIFGVISTDFVLANIKPVESALES